MKKNINLIITVIIAIMLIMLPISKTQAANFTLSNEKVTLDIEKSTSITINASTHTGRINITSSNTNVATVNTTSLWVENNSQTITISAKSEGNATITISGLLYDTEIDGEKEYTKTINVTVNKLPEVKPDPEPKPEPEPEPEPEQPETPKTLEFTSVNETVYATGTVNVRESYSASSKSLGQLNKDDSVTRTGVSKTSSEGYYWSKIIYKGTTAYAISSKLTTTEPKQEKPIAQEPEPEQPETPTVEEPTPVDEDIENDKENVGLKSLEIEGLTLSPTFSPKIYEYRVILKKDISELTINAEAAIQGATITIAGNENLQEGENLVTIVVYNAKNEAATYQITINKNTVDLTETDKILQIGNNEATRNLIIFIAVFAVAIVALIIIMILKHRKQSYEEDYDEIEEQPSNLEEITPFEEHTEIEQNVENADEKLAKEEYNENKKEKRKGKHF